MTLLGSRNPNVQHLRRLVGRRSARSAEGAFVIDGPVLAAEALAAGVPVLEAFIDGEASPAVEALVPDLEHAGARVHRLAPGVLAAAADTVTPNGIAVVARRPTGDLASLALPAAEPVVVLAGVADPGNAGTILRSAEAAGAAAVVAVEGSVDLYGPKTVRASAGAVLRLPVVTDASADAVIARLRATGVPLLGTIARTGTPYDEAPLDRSHALVLGNEAHGIGDEWAAAIDQWVTIPMSGGTESLNVAMAATVLAFEAARRRRAARTR